MSEEDEFATLKAEVKYLRRDLDQIQKMIWSIVAIVGTYFMAQVLDLLERS